MTILEFQGILQEKDYPATLIDEIVAGGLGDALIREAESNKNGSVRMDSIVEWIHIMENSLKIFGVLAEHFGRVEVLSQHNSTYKLRVMRASKSIGFVFGLLEDKKESCCIAEYSASQTTLEQIF